MPIIRYAPETHMRGNGCRAIAAKAEAQDGHRGNFVSDGDGGLGSGGGFASEGERDL